MSNMKNSFLPVLAICSFLVGFDSIVTIPLIPTISNDINISVDLGGLLVTSYALAYAISAPFFGALSDKIGRKIILLIGLFVFGLATILTGVSTTLSLIIIFRIITGIGAGMIEPVIFAIVSDRYSYEDRGKAIGIITGALIASSIVGVPIGGFLAQWTGWQWAFWLIGILSFLVLFVVVKVIPNTKTTKDYHKSLVNQLYTACTNVPVFLALLATFLYFGGLQGMFANSGMFYDIYYHYASGQIGIILMVAGVGSVIGSVLGGKLADKVGKKQVIVFSSLIVALLVFGLSMTKEQVYVTITIHVLWATFYGVGQSALTSLISELNPNARGTIMALNSSAMYLGSAFFTGIAAFLLNIGSFMLVGLVCGLANILVLIIVVTGMKKDNVTSSIVQNHIQ